MTETKHKPHHTIESPSKKRVTQIPPSHIERNSNQSHWRRLSAKFNFTVDLCKTAFLKKTKNVFQDQLLLYAGQMYFRMLQG